MSKLEEYGLDNSNLSHYLLDKSRVKDNLSVIEDILNEESKYLNQLQVMKNNNKLNFGGKLSSEELNEVFPKICSDVDALLKIDDSNLPEFGYPSTFKPNKRNAIMLSIYTLTGMSILSHLPIISGHPLDSYHFCTMIAGITGLVGAAFMQSTLTGSSGYFQSPPEIQLKKDSRVNLISVAAHEYTHHIQARKDFLYGSGRIFNEGHARTIQKEISKIYAQREDNEAFMYRITDMSVGEFKSTYLWMCKKHKLSPNQNLLKTKSSRDGDEKSERLLTRAPSPHAIGNTIFSIGQAREGKEIYSRVLNGNFKFVC